MNRRWRFRDCFGQMTVLIPKADASPKEAQHAVAASEAGGLLDDLFREAAIDPAGRDVLLALAGISSLDAHLYPVCELRRHLEAQLGWAGALVMVRESMLGARTKEVPAPDESAQVIESLDRVTGGLLTFEGRLFRLDVAARARGVSAGDDYFRLVRHDEARALLGSLASRTATAKGVRELLGRAADLLSPDGTARMPGRRVVLLRYDPPTGSQDQEAPDETPATAPPTKVARATTEIFIEVFVIDAMENPVLMKYRFEAPDGDVIEAKLDDEGSMRTTSTKLGSAGFLLKRREVTQ